MLSGSSENLAMTCYWQSRQKVNDSRTDHLMFHSRRKLIESRRPLNGPFVCSLSRPVLFHRMLLLATCCGSHVF